MNEKPSLQRLEMLAEKWLLGTITPEEAREYADWYNEGQDNPIDIPPDFALSDQEQRDRILAKIKQGHYQTFTAPSHSKRRFSYRLVAAAVLVIGLGISIFYIQKSKDATTIKNSVSNHIKDTVIRPGSHKATLMLANGTLINLHQSKNGLLAKQGNSQIIKAGRGQLVYKSQNSQPGAISTENNLLTIPKGGEFSITLGDGTKVWLNAASTLSYPCLFEGGERVVTLTGEAYFEVAHDPKHPFIVQTKGQSVKVLGTHFNINAYDDEAEITTTLLEGKVNVITASNRDNHYLNPGQQSVLYKNQLDIKKVNTEYAVAWHKGNFMFENENIETIMREIARWYDVSIAYEGEVPNDQFGGTISKFEDVKQVLHILQLTGKVHFTITGKKIIVSTRA